MPRHLPPPSVGTPRCTRSCQASTGIIMMWRSLKHHFSGSMVIIRGHMRRSSRPTVVTHYLPLGIFHSRGRTHSVLDRGRVPLCDDVVSLPLGVRRAYLLAHPAHIQHLAKTRGPYKGVSVGPDPPSSAGAGGQRETPLAAPAAAGDAAAVSVAAALPLDGYRRGHGGDVDALSPSPRAWPTRRIGGRAAEA